jgi:Protein of unknown function (DUF3085)
MILTFDTERIQRILIHSLLSPSHQPLYGQVETAKPGLWLVGDQGIYMMSNGKPGLPASPGEKSKEFVAYANECNPETLDFETWWSNKRESFGGDDGVEFIPFEDLNIQAGYMINSFAMELEPGDGTNGTMQLRIAQTPIPKKAISKMKPVGQCAVCNFKIFSVALVEGKCCPQCHKESLAIFAAQ